MKEKQSPQRYPAGRFLASVVLLAILSGATGIRSITWRDNITLWTDVAEKSPNKARPHDELGKALHAQRDFTGAMREFQTALRLDPDNAEFHNNLGMVYLSRGMTDDAIGRFQIALELAPEYGKAHLNLGVLYLEKGFVSAAKKEFAAVLSTDPDNGQALGFLNYIATVNKN